MKTNVLQNQIQNPVKVLSIGGLVEEVIGGVGVLLGGGSLQVEHELLVLHDS